MYWRRNGGVFPLMESHSCFKEHETELQRLQEEFVSSQRHFEEQREQLVTHHSELTRLLPSSSLKTSTSVLKLFLEDVTQTVVCLSAF